MMNDIPPPPTDTVLMVLEVNTEDLHFVDNIMKSHDNLAQVRRDFRTHKGRPCYEVWIAPDLVEEVQSVIDRLRDFIDIGICEILPDVRDE
jgi:hypothetical protein